MFINSVNPQAAGQPTVCVFSPCVMTAAGLSSLLQEVSGQVTVVLPDAPQGLQIFDRRDGRVKQVVIYLPDDPFWLLSTLRQAVTLFNQVDGALKVLILSRIPAAWLWRTVCNLSEKRGSDFSFHVVSPDLPCRKLAVLLRSEMSGLPALRQLSLEDEWLRGEPLKGITKKELDILIDFFNGDSIWANVEEREISRKTAYSQRLSGLKKMVECFPQLGMHLPRVPLPRVHQQAKGARAISTLSPFEKEFVHAIQCRHVSYVFQPVVDENMNIKGMDIMLRWNRDGKVLMPEEFLPLLSSGYVWLLLTAQTLQMAVARINHLSGKIYFSLVIHATTANNPHFVRMMETARRQLDDPQWSRLLALEFREIADPIEHKQAHENIIALQQLGFTVTLSGYFSGSNILFPLNFPRFNKYKLDKSVVAQAGHDRQSQMVIKCLLYYCQLTESDCVAEGVDSLEAFLLMRSYQIDDFEGAYISAPMREEDVSQLESSL